MQNFRRLRVSAAARTIVRECYHATATFPSDERFGLVAQMRRASVSIACNIAEGCGRSGDRELARFLDLAMGSASELQMLTLLAADLGIAEREKLARLWKLLLRLKKMLAALIKHLRLRAPHSSGPAPAQPPDSPIA